MDFQIIQLKSFDLLCLKRIDTDYKSRLEMKKIFNKNNYMEIITKYSPFRKGYDPLGANSETSVYLYEVGVSVKTEHISHYENGLGTVYDGEDYTPDSEELPEPLEVINVPGGEYIKIVMSPEYKTQGEFFDAIWEHLKKWGYVHEGDVILLAKSCGF